jgi:hypothetical protein
MEKEGKSLNMIIKMFLFLFWKENKIKKRTRYQKLEPNA